MMRFDRNLRRATPDLIRLAVMGGGRREINKLIDVIAKTNGPEAEFEAVDQIIGMRVVRRLWKLREKKQLPSG